MPLTFSEDDFAEAPASEGLTFSEDDFKAPQVPESSKKGIADLAIDTLASGLQKVAHPIDTLSRAGFELQKKIGLYPQDAEYGGMAPIVSPEQVANIRSSVGDVLQAPTPETAKVVGPKLPDYVGKGVNAFENEFASGMTSPEALVPIGIAGQAARMGIASVPTAVARGFQAQMGAQAPFAAKATYDAIKRGDREGAVKEALNTALSIAGPLSIERGLNSRLPRAKLASMAAERARTAQDAAGGVETAAEGQKSQEGMKAAQVSEVKTLHPDVEAAKSTVEGDNVKVVSSNETGAAGEPFANGQLATIKRDGKGGGTIHLNDAEINDWLARDVPPEKRAEAARTLLAEERIHLGTSAEHADQYIGTLTALEKAMERKLYPGKDISDTNLGFEAIRRRLQRLARMDTTETVSAVGTERWKLKSLEALNDTVRGIRETLGTKASKEGLAILDKVQANLDAGIVAAGGTPAAMRKANDASLEEVDKMSGAEYFKASSKWKDDAMTGKGLSVQAQAEQAALANPDAAAWEKANTDHRVKTKALFDEIKAGGPDAMMARQEELMGMGQKAQFYQEGLKILRGEKQPEPAAMRNEIKEESEPRKPNARLASDRPIQEPYSDKHSVSLQIAGADSGDLTREQILSALPKELADKVTGVRKFQGEVVSSNKALSVPARVEITFPNKETAQQAIDSLKSSTEPAAFRNLKRNLQDEALAAGAQFTTMVNRRGVTQDVARSIDSVEQTTNNLANQADYSVRQKSIVKPAGKVAQKLQNWMRGNKQVLHAANVLIESEFDPSRLLGFQNDLNRAKTLGQAEAASTSWRLRRQGQARLREVAQLQANLDYARAHFNDADLQATAKAAADSYADIHANEVANGYDVTKDPNYLPHRYVSGMRIGHQTSVMGKKFRQPKSFDSLFEAIANPDDVYISASHDAASLVGHRTRQSLNMINKDKWVESLKSVVLPTGQPLALEPITGSHGQLISPDPNYRLVPVKGARSLAVHIDYANPIQSLTSPDFVEMWGPSRAALHATQMLKHALLVGDFFHLFRMGYYGASILGKNFGWNKGWSVLDIAAKDIPEAVQRGVITARDAAWGNELVPYGSTQITRRALIEKFYQKMGSNLGKVQDALYKDLMTEGTSADPGWKRGLARAADPTIGRYNRFLFDNLTRGLMAESVAREFERQTKAKPSASPEALMKDIARDVNNFYGNIGRQGWFKAKWQQDLARLTFLAPQWVEGLIKKEAIAYSRLSGASSLAGQRKGVTALGTTGRSVGRAMLFMAALTQAINLITRGKPTWQNDEEGHKLDAWIPQMGSDKEGFWMSPLSVFNELTHDIMRYAEAKPGFMDAAMQIAANKESPITRALIVMGSGKSPTGEIQTTTGGRLAEAGKAIAPVPITFGRYAQAAGHALAPGMVSPPPPGAMQRQAFGTAGIKVEQSMSTPALVGRMAKKFMEKEGLTKDSGWVQEQTDQPSYTKLRSAIRSGDDAHALKMLNALRQSHTDNQIVKAMKEYSKRPWTGSRKTERMFLGSLTSEQLDAYSAARETLMSEFERFADWYVNQN